MDEADGHEAIWQNERRDRTRQPGVDDSDVSPHVSNEHNLSGGDSSGEENGADTDTIGGRG